MRTVPHWIDGAAAAGAAPRRLPVMHGTDGIRFFTRTKAVTERWPDPHTRDFNLEHARRNLNVPTTT